MQSAVRRGISAGAPALPPYALNVLVATYLLALCNTTFWTRLNDIFDGRPLAAAGFAGAVWALMVLVVSLLAVRRLQKPVLIALLLIAGVTSYYVDKLGVIVDREMIQNAVTTTFTESKHLITPAFLIHVALYGLLPSLVVAWIPVQRPGIVRGLIGWGLMTAGAAALCVGLLFIGLKDYSTVLRGHKELMASVQPLAPMAGALRYARMMMKATKIELQPTGTDATAGPLLARSEKPVLLVIVAGETGRAQNWSLSGYERQTNPELRQRDIFYFPHASSCGTATATSLPCMFSPLTRSDYSYEGGLSHENLLDVLVHAGFDVEWWDNNTGDKNVADRVPHRMMSADEGAEFCQDECVDGVFLAGLARKAETITKNTVVVLHTIGSHGPAYYLRYPADEEEFQPACHEEELTRCSNEEIVNAYDNTILYTDWFLGQVIDTLAASDSVLPAMFYASDHGESLGEGGLYLHGTPYFMAPDYQTHVPMVLWTAPAFRQALGLDEDCLADAASGETSHDNIFSTMLGLVDVTTGARDERLDLASGCRSIPAL